MSSYECPNDGPFEAEPQTKVSRSGYDKVAVDANGQHSTLADQLDASGVPLLVSQREVLLAQVNPAWTPTYEGTLLDEPVAHTVAVCPKCGSPIKVG